MKKTLNILFVDDHPMIIEGFISIIENFVKGYSFNFFKANDCNQAYHIIENNCKQKIEIDIAFFDISLPASKDRNILCGADLAQAFKDNFPNSKVVMVTMHSEGMLIHKIQEKLNPEGFLNKTDVDPPAFQLVFDKIIAGEFYRSITIENAILNYKKERFYLDSTDLEIINLLEKGVKTKDLPNHLGIALSAIEKRKAKIKLQILNDKGNDKDLIKRIKELDLL